MKIKLKYILIAVLVLIILLYFVNMFAVHEFMKSSTAVG